MKVVADVVFGFVPDVFDGAVGWEVDEVDVLEGVSLTEVGAEVFRGVPYRITGNQQCALVRRLPRVEEGGQVEIGNSSEPFTARTQAIDHLEFASFLDLPPALGDGDRPGPGNGGDIERERLRATDVGFPETAEKNAELGVRIGGGSERGTGVCAQPFLVDDDCGGQAAEKIDVRPVEGGLVAWRLNSFTVWWDNEAWRTNQPRPCRFVMVTKRYLRRWCVQAPQPQGQRSGRGSCCWPPRESRMR